MVEAAFNDCMANHREFKKLIEDSEKPSYPGCVKIKLATLVRFYKFKASNALTNKAFIEFLAIMGEILPESHQLSSSTYEAGKTMAVLGMEYEKIHACPNDCILYQKEFNDATSCPTCNTSRWKLKKNSTEP
ncbi:hypothetical protein Vadar_032610 [Vaccinium darrowii]|uniref:Uncharacterized protein n=1 Tax=Vaccinium darrowii TaxID=229202 RepID=A0ACB7Y4N9_9ERIC|nr:hypothetical protein Vadar_032610 [Vaccinium darrowii]